MSEKREGEKSACYCGVYLSKNTRVQEFKSNVAELKDAVFAINLSPADADKF